MIEAEGLFLPARLDRPKPSTQVKNATYAFHAVLPCGHLRAGDVIYLDGIGIAKTKHFWQVADDMIVAVDRFDMIDTTTYSLNSPTAEFYPVEWIVAAVSWYQRKPGQFKVVLPVVATL